MVNTRNMLNKIILNKYFIDIKRISNLFINISVITQEKKLFYVIVSIETNLSLQYNYETSH